MRLAFCTVRVRSSLRSCQSTHTRSERRIQISCAMVTCIPRYAERMSRPNSMLRSILVLGALVLPGCGDPPDETPFGRDAAATLARPEQKLSKVTVQHVLIAFVGATRGSESGRDYAQGRKLAEEVLTRARGGEDFAALMDKYSSDDGGGTYTLTQEDRYDYADAFHEVAFRLALGEIGATAYDPSSSPFGWHVIKRIE
ncbi:MAG: peptidylprolyl isomerase [Planctomycetota bacterium]